mgnify:CR=1 FL=1
MQNAHCTKHHYLIAQIKFYLRYHPYLFLNPVGVAVVFAFINNRKSTLRQTKYGVPSNHLAYSCRTPLEAGQGLRSCALSCQFI